MKLKFLFDLIAKLKTSKVVAKSEANLSDCMKITYILGVKNKADINKNPLPNNTLCQLLIITPAPLDYSKYLPNIRLANYCGLIS